MKNVGEQYNWVVNTKAVTNLCSSVLYYYRSGRKFWHDTPPLVRFRRGECQNMLLEWESCAMTFGDETQEVVEKITTEMNGGI